MGEVATLSANWAAAKAREIGFDLCGVAPAEDLAAPEHLADWLARGFAGEMRYLHNPRRGDLSSVVPEARSVIVCALNYDQPVPYSIHEAVAIPDPAQNSRADSAAGAPGFVAQVAGRARDAESTPGTISRRNLRLPDPLHSNERDSPRGWISRYAWGDDYHDVLGEKLELLVAALREKFGDQFAARAYVDTGPISERAAAKVAGIGWLGKNTCLINQEIGSWLFLCVIITSLPIAGDWAEETDGRAAGEAKEGGIPRRELLGMTGKEGKGQDGKEEADPSAASRPRDHSQIQMQTGEVTNASGPSTDNAGIVGGPATDGLDKRPLTAEGLNNNDRPGEGTHKNSGAGTYEKTTVDDGTHKTLRLDGGFNAAGLAKRPLPGPSDGPQNNSDSGGGTHEKAAVQVGEQKNAPLDGGFNTDGLDERPLTSPGKGLNDNDGPGKGTHKNSGLGVRIRPLDQLAPDLCGNCTMCLDACPTGALVEPYVMDARRCISYLTIELRGSIPEEFRRDIGWQVFGCDICQDVCPWNRDGGSATRGPARSAGSRAANLDAALDTALYAELDAECGAEKDRHVAAFAPRAGLVAPDLAWLLSLTEVDFRETFRGSPVKRTKWRGLIRNACVAAGNALRKQRVAGGAAAGDGAFGRARASASENVAGGASHSAGKGAQEHSALRARLAELAASDDAVIAEHARWALDQ